MTGSDFLLAALTVLITRIFIGIPLVTTFFSIPVFNKKKKSFKVIITIIILNFIGFSIAIIPIAKIVSFFQERYKKKKTLEKNIEQAVIEQNTNIELVYCPECGKAYAKGEEPCMCKCGYFFNK